MQPGLSAGCCKKTKKDEHDKREGLFLGRFEERVYWTETVETKDDSHSVFHSFFNNLKMHAAVVWH